MRTFQEFLTEAKKANILTEADKAKIASSKTNGIKDLVTAIRKWGEDYDISTRRFVWDHLNSPRGKELMEKILRNPKTYYSDSEFIKLVQKK
jgi:hypothetical protein